MIINEELVYAGENFNLVLDNKNHANCEECNFEIEDCADMFGGELPTVRKYEETITE